MDYWDVKVLGVGVLTNLGGGMPWFLWSKQRPHRSCVLLPRASPNLPSGTSVQGSLAALAQRPFRIILELLQKRATTQL